MSERRLHRRRTAGSLREYRGSRPVVPMSSLFHRPFLQTLPRRPHQRALHRRQRLSQRNQLALPLAENLQVRGCPMVGLPLRLRHANSCRQWLRRPRPHWQLFLVPRREHNGDAVHSSRTDQSSHKQRPLRKRRLRVDLRAVVATRSSRFAVPLMSIRWATFPTNRSGRGTSCSNCARPAPL